MRGLLSRAVSFFAKREMAGAFNRWAEFAEERKEIYGARRGEKRRRLGAFARWVEFAAESRELKATLARGLRFWVNGALARCFERWIEALDAARVARKTMKWWTERALVSSWLRWKERVVDAHTLRWAAQFSSNARWAPRSTDGSNTTRRRRRCVRCSPRRRRGSASPPPPRRGLVGSNASTTRASRDERLRILSARRRVPRSTAGSRWWTNARRCAAY